MHRLANYSSTTLNLLNGYDTFLESLKTICDMGCGTGEDITWWAMLESKDDPPVPYNYNCFAVDKDAYKLSQVPDLVNINKINRDITDKQIIPSDIDLMWSHDSLQYSHNPLETLRFWNKQMTVNGMLVLHVPQTNGVENNRYYSRTYAGCYYNYTPTNLIYMLAVNGFDCRDAYLMKRFNDPWIQMAVYKSDVEPMDPKTTTWFDLADKNLLHPSIVNSINKNGFLKQEEIIMPWLDKENYYIDWVPQQTVIPEAAGEPTVDGIVNKSVVSKKSKLQQATAVTKETQLLKPVGITRPPKERYVK
jgi:SAM-dependent methyltransferase